MIIIYNLFLFINFPILLKEEFVKIYISEIMDLKAQKIAAVHVSISPTLLEQLFYAEVLYSTFLDSQFVFDFIWLKTVHKNDGKIASWWQFHQHCLCSFFVQKCYVKLYWTYSLRLYFYGNRKLIENLNVNVGKID